ncbi:DUF6603 domain-containing protein [Halobaculum gomorrense]|uniref:DUF6603 domain-containing protein n=1 Tax=Halobaculum gomorrense TaxID=43928 RepID=A0A1M5PFP6_9EURY|nr:DUF6603 domain-containing protein [Halobaculum gomorrense]SHH00560.1 hypothetical protein SAMN05443636_1582 [Halobaculum gomorrense]
MATIAEALVGEAEKLFEPLERAAQDTPEGTQQLVTLFEVIGVDLTESEIDDVRSALGAFVTALDALESADDESLGALLELLGAIADISVAIEDISTALQGSQADEVVGDLIEYLALQYVQREQMSIYYVAVLLTLIDVEQPDIGDLDAAGRRKLDLLPYKSTAAAEFDFDQLGGMLETPIEELRSEYLPDGQVTEEELAEIEARLFPWLRALAATAGFRLAISDAAFSPEGQLSQPDVHYSRQLQLTLAVSDSVAFSLTIALAGTPDGVKLFFFPTGQTTLDESLGEWTLVVGMSGQTEPMLLSPSGIEPLDPSGMSELTAEFSLTKPPDPQTGNAFVLGPGEGTRLELGEVGVEGGLTATDAGLEGGFQGGAGNSSFVVDAGNADSFIQKILPEEGIAIDFDAGIGYHTERGLYFMGGAGITTDIPVNLDIAGVVKVETLRLAMEANPSGGSVTVPVQIAANPQVSLGPFDAVVKGIGLEAKLSFPQDNSGNLGPVHVDLGFKPPTGAGMSLDAGVVTGGGFLTFDHEKKRYSGVLQLKIGELTITAVGLLTTELPNGRDGFSLLLIISGQFPAFQLGFGFTLDGLGGLVGANRSIDVDYLTAGLSDGTVRSIMFPEDPVRNAPQIISDLRNGFPVAAGNHIVGPMAKLGWGTPSMLSASLGVLLDVPSPVRIVLLGRIHVGLPHEEIGIVVFNMDLLGAVDVEAQQANGAASLYDSRIVAYVLTGDMAVKTGWGDDATFVLSVGGFNPRFEPPSNFPSLDRIALSIGPGNPEVRLSGYFAVTSNTVQVGARVDAYAAAAGFSFEGKLGFDTLFRFQPFELVADFYAGFALKRGGSTLMSVDLDGTLKGPGPWNLHGKASFKIWPISFSVSVDAEFGPSKSADQLSPADIFGQVVSGLSDSRNWTAQRPAGGESIVTVRELKREGDKVLAHPLGQIAVRQQVAPMQVRIEKFGNGTPANYDRYEITGATVGGIDEEGETTRERFAPAEYFQLSNAEKLEGPEFERYAAGWRLGNTALSFGDQTADGVLDYETAVIDEQASLFPVGVGRIAMPASTARALASVSAVARGDLRTTGEARFAADDETKPTGVETSLSVGDAQYVVVTASDMTRLDVDGVPADGATRREAQEALDAYLAESGGSPEDYRVVATHEAAQGGQP